MPTKEQAELARQIVSGVKGQIVQRAAVVSAELDDKRARLHLETDEGPMVLYVRTVKPKKAKK